MSRGLIGMLVVACFAASAQSAAAQEGFVMGYTDVGPVIGLGGIGSASLAFGVRAEHAFKTLPDIGDGIIGIQAGADYYSWSSPGYKWSYIPLGVTANYHFVLENMKIDPFLGLGLGYSIISCSYSGDPGFDACGSSAIYLIGRAGGRYFFSEKMSAYADVGAGAALISLGVMFRLN